MLPIEDALSPKRSKWIKSERVENGIPFNQTLKTSKISYVIFKHSSTEAKTYQKRQR